MKHTIGHMTIVSVLNQWINEINVTKKKFLEVEDAIVANHKYKD